MQRVVTLHCYQCPIRDHCSHNIVSESIRLSDVRFRSGLTRKELEERDVEDRNRMQGAADNCTLLKVMAYHA